MSDLPPDLPRLRTLETWHTMQLDRIQAAIRAAEDRAIAEERERVHLATPPPDWVLEHIPNGAGCLHQGWCGVKGARPLDIDAARRALVDGAEACPFCRPDTGLGMLD